VDGKREMYKNMGADEYYGQNRIATPFSFKYTQIGVQSYPKLQVKVGQQES